MPPTIVPLYGLPDTGAGAQAELQTLQFLNALPDNYFILRELKTHPTFEKWQRGSREDRIDLVIIGPHTGVILLEVKDWNINRNTYEWIDQYNVNKTDASGRTERLSNPYAQVNEYCNAVLNILQAESQDKYHILHVSCFVVYPRLTRAEFKNRFSRENSFKGAGLQETFLVNLQQTLFRDDLDYHLDNPLNLLSQLVKSAIRIPYEEAKINEAFHILVPPKVRVGDTNQAFSSFERVKLMSDRQQRWAMSDDLKGKNYMLDVAGSGKTNIFVSRALHLMDRHEGESYYVLILTYSKALSKELERIRDQKIGNLQDGDRRRYRQSIVVMDVESLMEQILIAGMEQRELTEWQKQLGSKLTANGTYNEYIEYDLPEKCQDLLDKKSDAFRQFDYLLVDEIQDFSDFFLDIALSLLKKREHVFMVGDIGQKLFDREYHLSDHGIMEQRVRMKSEFLMYRSPTQIAQLSWSFLCRNSSIVRNLREEAYDDIIISKNTLPTEPVFKFCTTREALLQQVYEDITGLTVMQARPGQILCIGLHDTLSQLHRNLTSHGISGCWAEKADKGENGVTLADFTMSKGLERDYVFILDIDRLPDGSFTGNNVFQPQDNLEYKERQSRIKIFVALTRALREVYVYYTYRHSLFVEDLLGLQQGLRNKQ